VLRRRPDEDHVLPLRGMDVGAEGEVVRLGAESWLGLSEQESRIDKWNVCRVQAAAICGSPLK
jgi:hypothetical protein